jgi:hypothetical protein
MVFLTFLKFSLKFREQIHCKEAATNALMKVYCIYGVQIANNSSDSVEGRIVGLFENS